LFKNWHYIYKFDNYAALFFLNKFVVN